MSRRVKHFPCGHKGLGAYCHRCHGEQIAREKAAEARQQRAQVLAADPIDLSRVPNHVATKARRILRRLARGTPWGELQGKRLRFDRTVVSVPVGRDYRLLLRHEGSNPLVPLKLLSHQDYNKKKCDAPENCH